MSRGPGTIERRIADLLAATRDQALGVDDITDHAFGLDGARPTRAQRLSATRAAHRVLRRTRETAARADRLMDEAHARAAAVAGSDTHSSAYQAQLESDRGFVEGSRLDEQAQRIGLFPRWFHDAGKGLCIEEDHWVAETVKQRLYLHPPDVPVRVWAVSLGRGGITWAEAEVLKVTERNVTVRYAGEAARLDRAKLWRGWAFWRGVRFVSSRTGRIAARLDELWWRRFGAGGSVPPAMRMPLAEALSLLGVPADYTKADVIGGFRQAAKRAHPDAGGTADMFRKLVEARDRLLAALGTSEPPPEPPAYAPAGSVIVYRGRQPRLGSGVRRLA